MWFKCICSVWEGCYSEEPKHLQGERLPSIIYLATKCSGLLVSALLACCLLPLGFLFTHSFCFLITLARIWFWLVAASSLPPGTLSVSVPFLTGLALGVFWIKFPWVRVRSASSCFQSHPDHRSLASLWIACPLGQVPTALPRAEGGGGGGVQLRPLWSQFPCKGDGIHNTDSHL